MTTEEKTQKNELTLRKDFWAHGDDMLRDLKIENYKKVLKKNVALRNKFIQDYDELSAGVLMLAEIAGITVPTDLKARDIISELAVILEQKMEGAECLNGN